MQLRQSSPAQWTARWKPRSPKAPALLCVVTKTPLSLPKRPTTVISPGADEPTEPDSPMVPAYAPFRTSLRKTTSDCPVPSRAADTALRPRASVPSALTTANEVLTPPSSAGSTAILAPCVWASAPCDAACGRFNSDISASCGTSALTWAARRSKGASAASSRRHRCVMPPSIGDALRQVGVDNGVDVVAPTVRCSHRRRPAAAVVAEEAALRAFCPHIGLGWYPPHLSEHPG